MTDEQSKALRLADLIDANLAGAGDAEISAELRRLHAENEDFRATIDHLTRENAGQIGEIVALKEQRDELLGALRSVWLWMEDQADGQSKGGHATFDLMLLREQRDIARAAITKAEGEKS